MTACSLCQVEGASYRNSPNRVVLTEPRCTQSVKAARQIVDDADSRGTKMGIISTKSLRSSWWIQYLLLRSIWVWVGRIRVCWLQVACARPARLSSPIRISQIQEAHFVMERMRASMDYVLQLLLSSSISTNPNKR